MGEQSTSSHESSFFAAWSAYKVPVILGSISLLLVGLAITLLLKSSQTATPIKFSDDALGVTSEATQAASVSGLMVDVAGAVVKPGVYRLGVGARIEEALTAAGGLGKNADVDWVAKNINRAMKVSDGVKLYIPKTGEMETSHINSPLLRSPDGTPQNGGGVSVNMASQSELESLPGVGPVTAQKIIDNRPYTSLDQLVSKKAIGQSLYDKLKNQLSL